MSWRPVADQEPPRNQRVLGWCEGAVQVVVLQGAGDKLEWLGEHTEDYPEYWYFNSVSHWMPLPEGPEC